MEQEDSKIVDGAEDVEERLTKAEEKIERLERLTEDYEEAERRRLGGVDA